MKKNSNDLKIGFDIKVQNGPVLKPLYLTFWNQDQISRTNFETPFYYMSDALVGLSFIHLNDHLKNPFLNPGFNFSFCHEAWLAVEPHYELYQRAQTRVNAIRRQLKKPTPEFQNQTLAFEKNLNDILNSCIEENSINLHALTDLIDSIEYFENKIESQLLYNFNVQFSRQTVDKLHYLHSFLFNLRALMAIDHNAHVEDSAFESIKVDSITDYISKAEYVTNDAIIYLHYKKSGQVNKVLEKSFRQYNHNGFCLVESMPASFLSSFNKDAVEETLHLVQMDWLLGTPSGLLFKIREELYGLKEGYDKVFWHDVKNKTSYNQSQLSLGCKLDPKTIFPDSSAA